MEFLAAEIVVGAQKKVVSEDAVFLASQAPLGDPEEVGEILFPFAGEDASAGGAVAGLPGNGGGALAEGEAFLEAGQTRTKHPTKHAIAGNVPIFAIQD
jgi:hypothetical protein